MGLPTGQSHGLHGPSYKTKKPSTPTMGIEDFDVSPGALRCAA